MKFQLTLLNISRYTFYSMAAFLFIVIAGKTVRLLNEKVANNVNARQYGVWSLI